MYKRNKYRIPLDDEKQLLEQNRKNNIRTYSENKEQ